MRKKLEKSILKAGLLLACLSVSACDNAEEVVAPPVRSVKTVELKVSGGQQSRRLAGIVEAQTISILAFEVPGRVVELAHDIGERVAPGEIIARLDKQPYELQIKAAEATLSEAQARRRNAQSKFTQQEALFKKGFASKTALDTAQANLETSSSSVEAAQAQLDLVKRDLAKTELRAPFEGSIGERYIEPFSEVTSGQRIYQVNSEGKNEVRVSAPEGLIQNIAIGDQVAVEFPTVENLAVSGKVIEVGSRATTANAFPVTVALDDQPSVLRPGMTAQTTFRFGTETTDAAFLLPVTAVIAMDEDIGAAVYVFNQGNGIVERRMVDVINVIGNELEVTGNLSAGENIVTGGVSFLHDGMKVRAMTGKVR